MFTIFMVGFPTMRMPFSFSCWMTFMTALFACLLDVAPTQTIFPVLKIKCAVLGFFNLKMAPGNFWGLYTTLGTALMMEFKSRDWLRLTEATTFTMLTLAFTLDNGNSLILLCSVICCNDKCFGQRFGFEVSKRHQYLQWESEASIR